MVCAGLFVPTDCDANVRLAGVSATVGAEPAVPVPLKATVCGLPLALSAMETEAVRVPAAVGLNVTLIVQLALAAIPVPHVLVWLKSTGSVPEKLILEMVSVAVPLLVNVMF
jgi:hypothetical protein